MTLGVLGTLVWDTIEHPSGQAVERWGGIAYSLAAAAAALPESWSIRPLIRLGTDFADRAWGFLAALPSLERPGGVIEVEEPNNRVTLRYRDAHHRDEQLTGGVAGWAWQELEPHLQGLDGLYVNLVSGFELDRVTASRLGHAFAGPRYVDLHAFLLGIDDDGRRSPARPEAAEAWIAPFHVVQANRTELATLAADRPPEDAARTAVEGGLRAFLVTRGPEGAAWFAADDGPVWSTPAGGGPVRSGTVPLDTPESTGDPTGCGDVWGATCFVHLMQGRGLRDAMIEANRAAVRNVDHRGADGLYQHLRDRS